jgi:AcrR family transcriptional regulator
MSAVYCYPVLVTTDASPTHSDERPLRRDAARNRELILAAAGEVFASRGLEVTLDDIAHHAGVGVGTVYRRFHDKEQLIDALFDERMDAVVTAAEEALEAEDPWLGLEGFFVAIFELQAADRGLRELAFAGRHGRERVALVRARLEPLVEELVTRAQASGDLRGDVCVDDVPIIQKMLAEVIGISGGVSPDLWRRYLTIVLDGLRTRRDGPTPLPVAALEHGQLEACMQGWRAPRSARPPSAEPRG